MKSTRSTSIVCPYRSPEKSKKYGSSNSLGGSKLGRTPRVAAPALAEGEILAGRHTGHAEMLDQTLTDEFLCRQPGECRVEREHVHRVHARRREQSRALVHAGQPKPGTFGTEIAHRVRIEG